MARPVILGNNALTVGLNENGLVHDFYYPYVGLENLTTARQNPHFIGIWLDGYFSWIHDSSVWNVAVDFREDALISEITVQHIHAPVKIVLQDFVDTHYNLFSRKVTVHNDTDTAVNLRLFFHQNFQISHGGRADTAMYVPDDHYILDYKGRCSILAYAQADGKPFDQYAVGNTGIEGKEGTFKDAEDGELSNSAVEHGGVDSVIRVSSTIAAHGTSVTDYWLIVADSQQSVEHIHSKVLESGIDERRTLTESYWKDWLKTADPYTEKVEAAYKPLLKKSLMVIKAHIDKHGGIIASCDSSIYNYGRDYYTYVWPRDGAYALWPLIRLGFIEEAKRFFEFCRDIQHEAGYLMHKYQPDKAIGSTWHPLLHNNRKELAIQEDETATVLFMISEYLDYTKDIEFVRSLYDGFMRSAALFLMRFVDEQTNLPHASYDLWEEKFLTSTYTTAVTMKALEVTAAIAKELGHHDDTLKFEEAARKIKQGANAFFDQDLGIFRKGFLLSDGNLSHDSTLDISSFYGAFMFDYYDNPEQVATMARVIESVLLDKSPCGGTPRYKGDNYFKGKSAHSNPWFVTTLWMAQYYMLRGNKDKARHYLEWTKQHALPSGVLSEQIDPESGAPVSVTPLVWSHAELINTLLDYSS